jgi:pimeloyl-ACP methyl ester carboxylesterase
VPIAAVNGIEIHYESVGEGFPVVFCHEFASNSRSFAAQVRHFARRYRVVTWNYRGYPPSSVPSDPAAYSQDLVVDDLRGLLDSLSIAEAHIVGAATGSNVALNFAIGHPDRTRSLVVGGVGVGSFDREPWLAAAQEMADDIAGNGIDAIVRRVSTASQRRPLRTKDPKGWEEFLAILRELSPQGAELSMRGVMMKRKPVTELEAAIAALAMPLFVMVGDQDAPAFESSLFVYRKVRRAALAVLPASGHDLPAEEPELFNRLVGDFLCAVDGGRWGDWRPG